MWFIYTSYYLAYVVGLPANIVGLAILSGQIADAFTTPVVGIVSDKFSKAPLGKRNCWYLLGTLLVIPGFFGIFVVPPFM